MNASSAQVITDGMVVLLHYTLKDDDGEVLDSSNASQPLEYLHGAQNIVPGLERGLGGRKTGERLQLSVPPALGYGERRADGLHSFPRAQFPEEFELVPGMAFTAELENGDTSMVWVSALRGDEVVIDLNQPLAGKTLHFDVSIAGMRAATPEELQHGHPHGPGGHHH